MKRCPFCNKSLRKYSSGGYMEPPESGEVCENKKCGKYADKYFYYDGVTLICGNWVYEEKNSNIDIDTAYVEFRKRIKHQLKRRSRN
ncbi:hypothetical protein B0H39_003432 [Clostridium beijerinckii]|uniref:hypothetical protein n=1 Tax=Clostridium beijerinckii TaxID=1520 RepID=UPI00149486CB|nr:hypothetical protein [Clostridium beijerinckii]NOW85551.1 hypothetical protein [Clostridium beijerinckii]